MTQSPCQDTYSDIDGEPLLDEEESSETCCVGSIWSCDSLDFHSRLPLFTSCPKRTSRSLRKKNRNLRLMRPHHEQFLFV